MKRILIFVIILILFNTYFVYAQDTLVDIDKHWAKVYIESLYSDGIVSGYSDCTFRPNESITIPQFLKMIITMGKYKMTSSELGWQQDYINTAISHHIIDDSSFKSNDYLSRKECVKILSNILDLKDVKKSKVTFKDVSDSIEDSVKKLVTLNIFSGYDNGTFNEDKFVTRAEACKILVLAFKAKSSLCSYENNPPNPLNSNIGESDSNSKIKNRFTIDKNRIHIKDVGRYGSFDGITLNQEYINDSKVIKLINSLTDDNSYTYVAYVPDKYSLNKLNICYGLNESQVNNGIYAFQIRFYENGLYNLKENTGIESFSDKAKVCISLYKMWDFPSEYDSTYSSSEKNLAKLEKAVDVLTSSAIKKDFMSYIKSKIQEAKAKPDDEFDAKIQETKNFGNFTVNTICTQNQRIDFYIT